MSEVACLHWLELSVCGRLVPISRCHALKRLAEIAPKGRTSNQMHDGCPNHICGSHLLTSSPQLNSNSKLQKVIYGEYCSCMSLTLLPNFLLTECMSIRDMVRIVLVQVKNEPLMLYWLVLQTQMNESDSRTLLQCCIDFVDFCLGQRVGETW